MAIIPPVIKFHEFATSGVNPSGQRHLQSHSSFVKELGTGAGEYMDFGSKNINQGKQTSITTAVVAFAGDFNSANEAIFNLRFYITDFSSYGAGSYYFNGLPSGLWMQDINLTDASGYFVPTSLPSGQNWWRDAGGPFDPDKVAFQEITGSGTDDQVTMPFYLSVTADNDVPPKTYGGDAGGFTYRLTYDFR
jgi:hypothetical protein